MSFSQKIYSFFRGILANNFKKILIFILSISLVTFVVFRVVSNKFWAKSFSLTSPQISPNELKRMPGEKWIEPKTGIEFVWIPGGCYFVRDFLAESKNKNAREVCVKGFYMMTHEVTREQYRFFANESKYKSTSEKRGWSLLYNKDKQKWLKVKGCYWDNPGFDNKNNHPVVHVSFEDASAMGDWLTKKDGLLSVVRLPTEAEWEYACRSGEECAVMEKTNDVCDYANIHDETSYKENDLPFLQHACNDGFALTAPIKSFKPNKFGLYDMIGNVWEWVLDDYAANAYLIYPRMNPMVKTLFPWKGILRGGGWPSTPLGARCDYRLPREKTRSNCDLGFRLIMIPTE